MQKLTPEISEIFPPKIRKYACTKPNCAHCQWLANQKPEPIDPFRIEVRYMSDESDDWQPDEILYFRRNFHQKSYYEMGMRLHKSMAKMHYKANQLHLTPKKRIRDGKLRVYMDVGRLIR